MTQVNIDPRKIAGVVNEANNALIPHGFNTIEIVIGLAELMGRIIVSMGGTSVQSESVVAVAKDHLDRTIRIGTIAQHTTTPH